MSPLRLNSNTHPHLQCETGDVRASRNFECPGKLDQEVTDARHPSVWVKPLNSI